MTFQVTRNPRVIKTIWTTLTLSSPCPWLSPPMSTNPWPRSPLPFLYLFSAKQISPQRNEPGIKIFDRLKQTGCQVMAAPPVYVLYKRITPLQGTQSNGNFFSFLMFASPSEEKRRNPTLWSLYSGRESQKLFNLLLLFPSCHSYWAWCLFYLTLRGFVCVLLLINLITEGRSKMWFK